VGSNLYAEKEESQQKVNPQVLPTSEMQHAYRYVTDEQRSRRPFSPQPWAGASGLFFLVARSTRMTQRWALYRQSGSDRALKKTT